MRPGWMGLRSRPTLAHLELSWITAPPRWMPFWTPPTPRSGCWRPARGRWRLHASRLAAGLPDRLVPVTELRVLLLHPATGPAARNAVWAELVRRARAGDPAWTVALAGIAMPGLRRAVASLAPAYRGDPADLQSEVLAGFLAAMRALDLDELEEVPLASRLCWAARRAGEQLAFADAAWAARRQRPRRPGRRP